MATGSNGNPKSGRRLPLTIPVITTNNPLGSLGVNFVISIASPSFL